MSGEADRQLVAHPCGLLAEHENPMAEWRVSVFSADRRIGADPSTLQWSRVTHNRGTMRYR